MDAARSRPGSSASQQRIQMKKTPSPSPHRSPLAYLQEPQQQQQQFQQQQSLAPAQTVNQSFDHSFDDPYLLEPTQQQGINYEYDAQLAAGMDPSYDASLGLDNTMQLSDQAFDDFVNFEPSQQSLYTAGVQAVQPTDMPLSQTSSHSPLYDTSFSNRPRNSSLDPSAAFAQDQQWNSYRHMRTSSDQHSEVSSNHPSPFLNTASTFDADQIVSQHDPVLFGQDPSFGLGQFTLSDKQSHTPAHSAHASPYMAPQQASTMTDQFNLQNTHRLSSAEPFPSLGDMQELGQADQMSPPEIRFDPAPPSKQPSFDFAQVPPHFGVPGGLGLPGGKSPSTSPSRQRRTSDGLHPSSVERGRSVSPSPSINGNGRIDKNARRKSSPAQSPYNQERMLEMAERAVRASPAPSDGGDGGTLSRTPSGAKRMQKHPANYECHMCPKRFTRAYNLRSHLRTHTDERPFVCTVCSKAFARQHDRKRHEGLHSGEKKFVCKGIISAPGNPDPIGTWGCGRRFARADALGRHFRSEGGRACIKPLLDEEARQRRQDQEEQLAHLYNTSRSLQGQGQADPLATQQIDGMSGLGVAQDGPLDYSSIPLPAVLLEQFPALREIQWNAPPGRASLGAGGGGGAGGSNGSASDYDASDYEGRSSFDGGSGFEDDDDEDDDGEFDDELEGSGSGGQGHDRLAGGYFPGAGTMGAQTHSQALPQQPGVPAWAGS